MKKRYLALVLALGLTMTACGSTTNNTQSESAAESSAAESSVEESSEESAAESSAEESSEVEPITYKDMTSTVTSLGEYKGLKATKSITKVTDADVDAEVQSFVDDQTTTEDVEKAAEDGDIVVIDYTGYVDGETSDSLQGTDYSLELGSDTFIDGFEDQLIGASAGDDVEVNVTFPDDYQAEEMAGKDAKFDVHVQKVQQLVTPELTDELVKNAGEYDSIQDMKDSIRADLEKQAEEDADTNLQYELTKQLIDSSTFDVQNADVDAYLDQFIAQYATYATYYGMETEEFLQSYFGMSSDEVRDTYRDTAAFQVKLVVALNAIAEKEGITVTDEDCEAKAQEVADEGGYDLETVKSYYTHDILADQIILDKTLDYIVENADVTEEVVDSDAAEESAEESSESTEENDSEEGESEAH